MASDTAAYLLLHERAIWHLWRTTWGFKHEKDRHSDISL